MKHFTTVGMVFEAGHQVDGHLICELRHGHRWQVWVTVAGGLDPKKVQVVDHGELLAALTAVVTEFANNDLNDMLPGVITTPEGIALYIRERLILDWPRIVTVVVQMGDNVIVRVESEIR